MIELLNPISSENILDIWSGSWWTTTLLWKCVWNKWHVLWLEKNDELVIIWNKNIKKYNLTNTKIQKAGNDLWIVWKKFDKILVSASANEIPKELIDQLFLRWTIVIPIKNSIFRIKKMTEDINSIEEFPNFKFVPLIKWK